MGPRTRLVLSPGKSVPLWGATPCRLGSSLATTATFLWAPRKIYFSLFKTLAGRISCLPTPPRVNLCFPPTCRVSNDVPLPPVFQRLHGGLLPSVPAGSPPVASEQTVPGG